MPSAAAPRARPGLVEDRGAGGGSSLVDACPGWRVASPRGVQVVDRRRVMAAAARGWRSRCGRGSRWRRRPSRRGCCTGSLPWSAPRRWAATRPDRVPLSGSGRARDPGGRSRSPLAGGPRGVPGVSAARSRAGRLSCVPLTGEQGCGRGRGRDPCRSAGTASPRCHAARCPAIASVRGPSRVMLVGAGAGAARPHPRTPERREPLPPAGPSRFRPAASAWLRPPAMAPAFLRRLWPTFPV